MPKTLYDKIWDSHVIVPETDAPAIIFIDLHLIHEVTSPQAFDELRKRGLRVRRTDLTVGTADHSIPTRPALSRRRKNLRPTTRLPSWKPIAGSLVSGFLDSEQQNRESFMLTDRYLG